MNAKNSNREAWIIRIPPHSIEAEQAVLW